MNSLYYEQKLTAFREEWKRNPDKRSIIELQVRALKLGMKLKAPDGSIGEHHTSEATHIITQKLV